MSRNLVSGFTPEVLNALEIHCKARHPVDPAEGLRMVNEIRLLQWELECARDPMNHPVSNRTSSQFDDHDQMAVIGS